jgi:hypothetical protein
MKNRIEFKSMGLKDIIVATIVMGAVVFIRVGFAIGYLAVGLG